MNLDRYPRDKRTLAAQESVGETNKMQTKEAIGIRRQDAARIFGVVLRSHADLDDVQKGLGLGLEACRILVAEDYEMPPLYVPCASAL